MVKSCSITYEQVLDASFNAVILTDQNGIVIFVNQKAKDIFKDRLVSKPISKALPNTAAFVEKCIQKKQIISNRQITENGFNAVLNVSPVKEGNKIIGAISVFKAFSEYEKFAEKLESYKKQNKLLNAVFNASSDGLWVLDKNGVFIDVNPAAERIMERSREDLVGSRFDETNKTKFDENDISFAKEIFSTKRRLSLFAHYSESDKKILSTATPVFDDDGNILYVVGNERDMTELDRTKNELYEARQISDTYKDKLNELQSMQLKTANLVAENKKMQYVVQMVLKLSTLEATPVMITGESGTGKGLLCKFFHESSPRKDTPFIPINCAAIPENLLEAELFGYVKGAFTGAADKGKVGLIELAHGGILFLDEIGDMPMMLQAKLLKYLDDHEVMRLGSVKSRKVDCCIISATNQDLEKRVREKKFRQDLYYRLSSFQIHIPPLRERPEDIFELVRRNLEEYNKKYSQNKKISLSALETLASHSFKGNVRELKNLLKQAVVMHDEELIDDFVYTMLGLKPRPERHPVTQVTTKITSLDGALNSLEKQILQDTMKRCHTTREMAKALDSHHSTIVRKMKKHGLTR